MTIDRTRVLMILAGVAMKKAMYPAETRPPVAIPRNSEKRNPSIMLIPIALCNISLSIRRLLKHVQHPLTCTLYVAHADYVPLAGIPETVRHVFRPYCPDTAVFNGP